VSTRSDLRSLSGEAQAAIRERAVRAVIGGMSHREAAQVFGVERAVVSKWMRRWRDGGWEGLKERRRGRRPGEQVALEPWQQALIVRLIKERNPDQLKLPGFLWTRDAVLGLIDQRFGIRLAVTTVGRYLRSWGFTPQVPARRALERDPEAVTQWLKERYPKIRAKAKRDGGIVLWQDETGFRSECSHGRSWSPKGKTPVREVTGQRFGVNMIFAIGNDGSLRFSLFEGKFNQFVFIDFLERLIRQHPDRKVYLIVDGHPSHRSKLVKQWVAEHAERIELHYLPGYSPELNPVELLNHDVKANAVGRQRPRSLRELIDEVRSYLHGRQQQPHIIKRFFTHPDTAYAA
jgi:transposase